MPKRRSAKNERSLYAVLGTNSRISQDRIREKYVQKVKEYPPETHPEQFRQVRAAYDRLRDPEKRRLYDQERSTGLQLDDIRREIAMCARRDDWHEVVERMEATAGLPDLPEDHAILAQAYLVAREDKDAFLFHAEEAVDHGSDVQRSEFYLDLLSAAEDAEEYQLIYDWAAERRAIHPQCSPQLLFHQAVACSVLGREEEAWELGELILPHLSQMSIEEAEASLYYVQVMFRLNRLDKKSVVLKNMVQYAKKFSDPEEQEELQELYWNNLEYLESHGMPREALFLADLLCQLDPKNKQYREQRRQLKRWTKLFAQLRKLMKDDQIYPGATAIVAWWFGSAGMGIPDSFSDYMDLEEIAAHVGLTPTEAQIELAGGLQDIRKRHPELYKEFKDQWEEAFSDALEGLNRQERRALR